VEEAVALGQTLQVLIEPIHSTTSINRRSDAAGTVNLHSPGGSTVLPLLIEGQTLQVLIECTVNRMHY
jgi:hypothetical protein